MTGRSWNDHRASSAWSTLEDTRTLMTADDTRMPMLHGRYRVPHFDAKAEADAHFTHLPSTFLIASFYWDNLYTFGLAPKKGEDGVYSWAFPLADKRLAGVAAEDIGQVAYGIFKAGRAFIGKRVGVASEHLTIEQMGAKLSKALGIGPVVYHDVSADAYRAFGFPGADEMGNMMQVYRDFEKEINGARDTAVTRSLYPGLMTFDQFLAKHGDKNPALDNDSPPAARGFATSRGSAIPSRLSTSCTGKVFMPKSSGFPGRSVRRALVLCALVLLTASSVRAQRQTAPRTAPPQLTTPKQQFGHDIGDDYVLVNYTQYVEYLQKLDRESDRMTVVEIGKTEEGRAELMAIITSPENHRKLAHYKELNRKLALAEGLTSDQARQLAKDGKAVVWIDGGLHATEVLGAQQLIETIYRLNAKTDAETLRILDDDIILCVLVNPDGMEMVSNWYMRESNPQERSTAGLPRLYQKYIGHDNNRDFYMMNMSESANANRVMYREWYPAIMYNHHQTGPAGAVLFAPPFRDPFNYNFDPLIPLGIDMVGSAIHTRLAVEGKPGAVMRTGAPYSTWFNGGIRTTSYFHNQIGILTEMIGNPTPVEIPFVPDMQLPRGDVPNPIAPQTWHFRQSIEYSVTTNYAILDLASKRKEDFLFNMYTMGKNAIDKGSRDSWTIHPKRIEAAKLALESQPAGRTSPSSTPRARAVYDSVLRDPKMRDPRGFILSADQPDVLTATKFVNTLIKAGVVVHRATAPFGVAGRSYPAGSYVVKSAQAFRAHLLDLFEPQDHPDDIPYPGGAPRPPYDVTGYNIAYSMGIAFDRLLDGFDGPFEKLADVVAPPASTVTAAPATGGYLLSHQVNDAFVAVNRLLKANEDVYWLKSATTVNGKSYPVGTMFVPAKSTTLPIVQKAAADKGLRFEAVAQVPSGEKLKLKPTRIGLWDQYGGSMPSGWTRWIFEQYEFPFEVVYAQLLDAGDLNARFDVLVFVDGGIPPLDSLNVGAQPAPERVPADYRASLGRVSVTRTIPQIRTFVENGGTVLTIGSSTALGYHLKLPVSDALVERTASGIDRALPRDKHYVPGSILEARVDNTQPLAYGMPDRAMVFHDESPAFRLRPESAVAGVTPIAWYESAAPLRSGWAWGQHYLDQAVSIVEAPVGKGHVVLFGNEVAWRAQPHGTFKLLFNGIYYGGATLVH